MKKAVRIFDSILAVFLAVIYIFIAVGYEYLPNNIITYSSGEISYNRIYTLKNNDDEKVDFQKSQRVSSSESSINILGVIPVKDVTVSQREAKKVFVSGDSFGIKLYTDGVIVVGTKNVKTSSGEVNPAKDAGIEKGDIIVEINGEKMTSATQVEKVLNDNNGKAYRIKVKRNSNYKTFSVTPVFSPSEGCYKVGLWVRDSTAGIGTITFFNPENDSFAALGHPITDVDTNEIMPILEGEAVKTTVTKLYKSRAGEAGSLCCDFSNDVIAELGENTQSGIYGKYDYPVNELPVYEVASPDEIEKGPAQIICTVDDGGPKLYSVEITRVSYRSGSVSKNMVVKVVDNALLKKTGGIVQGMSGSPIIQNGKLVGALTHVIVDNPEKGYAVFAQTMVEESENVIK
ncbi:MAG: SpoIVB peptidase [Eubacteriales bacterium]|nr:SpoIVB peptidase [Eubacteriales bacterium]